VLAHVVYGLAGARKALASDRPTTQDVVAGHAVAA